MRIFSWLLRPLQETLTSVQSMRHIMTTSHAGTWERVSRLILKLASPVTCLFFCLAPPLAFASNIILFIKDSDSRLPISGAMVIGTNKPQFFSDKTGQVMINNVTPPVILQISHDGYLTVEETIQSNASPITIFLSKDAIELDTIVIQSDAIQ